MMQMYAGSLHFGILHEIFALVVVFLLGKILSLALLNVELVHDLLINFLRLVAIVVIFVVDDVVQVVAERGAT